MGLVIPVEVVRGKTQTEGSREAVSFLYMSLRSSYVALTGRHNNREFGGLVRENAEGTEKFSFLSLGGIGLPNLGGIILLSLGGIILLNIRSLGLGRLLGSGRGEGEVDPFPICIFCLYGMGLRMKLSGDDILIPQVTSVTFPLFL